jgi:hypothetical protein
MMSDFIEHEHNGVKFYECEGVYFYAEDGYFKSEKEMHEAFEHCLPYMKNRPIYIFKSFTNGGIRCNYSKRMDCKHERIIDGKTVMYREADIDFSDVNISNFIECCFLERRNYNVVCFVHAGRSLGGNDIISDLTLSDFFQDYCSSCK